MGLSALADRERHREDPRVEPGQGETAPASHPALPPIPEGDTDVEAEADGETTLDHFLAHDRAPWNELLRTVPILCKDGDFSEDPPRCDERADGHGRPPLDLWYESGDPGPEVLFTSDEARTVELEIQPPMTGDRLCSSAT